MQARHVAKELEVSVIERVNGVAKLNPELIAPIAVTDDKPHENPRRAKYDPFGACKPWAITEDEKQWQQHGQGAMAQF